MTLPRPATWRQAARRIRYGGLSRYCPLCHSHLRLFLPHGVVKRPNAVCPVCLSRDRHRLAWLWLARDTQLLVSPIQVLHVAPEAVVARRLQSLPKVRYVSGDLVHRASVRMDVGQLPFPAAVFDLVYCSHVLNMLPDDRPALAEIFRVLRPGGLALLQVPAPLPGRGVEAGLASTLAERSRLLGDPDMYRRYGSDDLAERLADAGFDARSLDYFQTFTAGDQIRLGLIDEPLHLCYKPDSR